MGYQGMLWISSRVYIAFHPDDLVIQFSGGILLCCNANMLYRKLSLEIRNMNRSG